MTDYNYKLIIAYDGTKYYGWQKQKKTEQTIQGKVENVLSKLFNENINVIGSGRTDAGVHALHQTANFHTKKLLNEKEIKDYMNNYLPEDIIIKEVSIVDNRFHSRFNAKSKTYYYIIWKNDADEFPLFERKYVYQYNKILNTELMINASRLFEGKHDFKGFSSDKTKKSTERTINYIKLIEDNNKIIIYINGDGFLYNMVRIIVGTLIEIGTNERDISTINKVLIDKNREEAGFTAPSKGLFLEKVMY